MKSEISFDRSPEKTIPLQVVVANNLLNSAEFVDFIDNSTVWDKKQSNVSPGNLAKSVILSTFFEVRSPLYRIEERFKNIDTEKVFSAGVRPEDLNDDSIAKALDKLSEINPTKLFSTLCLTYYKIFNITCRSLRSDTTSITFSGAYECCEKEGFDGLKIVNGYNKDHRPDLKQIVLGKIVNEHGISLIYHPMNGNKSDIEWNQEAIKLLREIFGERLNEMTYTADCKLITLPTLKILNKDGEVVFFVSLCPGNFYNKISARLIEKAHLEGNWSDEEKIGESKNSTKYRVQEYTEEIDGHNYRLIVVKSSAGTGRVEKKLNKERKELEKEIRSLEKKEFACVSDALVAIKDFKKKKKKLHHVLDISVNKRETEKRPPGNPGKNPKSTKIETKWYVTVEIKSLNEERVKKLKEKEESFVLITNRDKKDLGSIDVLKEYKGQFAVETQFRLLKSPAVAAQIFLKKPGRIEALAMLLNISLLIRGLMQYKVRKNLNETEEELPKIGRNHTTLKNPTAQYIIDTLSLYHLAKIGANNYSYKCYGDYGFLRISTLFKLLEIDLDDPF